MSESRVPGLVRLFVLGCVLIAPVTESGEWATYQNEKFGYEIDYPAGWEVIEARSRTNDTAHRAGEILIPGVHQWVTFKEPEGKLWPGTLEVRVHEHDEGQTLDQWADSTNVDVYDDSLVTGTAETVLAGRPAKRFSVFSFDHTGIIVAFIHDGKVYEIRHAGSNPNDPDIEEHASVYEQMQRTFKLAPSTPTGTFDLGGPCDDGLGESLSSFYAEFAEAVEQTDHERMIDLQKLYVRAMCSNHYRWYDLAELYLGADRPDVATQILNELHLKGAEIKPVTFEHHDALAAFIQTADVKETKLGRELLGLRQAAAQRKAQWRKQLDALDATSRPAESHVAENACPFECCTYGEWQVLETTPLRDVPAGSATVGSAAKGESVSVVTGEVHLRPEPIAVVHDHPPFTRGEIIFVLDYLGEGFFRYWRDGAIAEEQLWIDEMCLRPSKDCWAEYIRAPEDRQEPRWWILMEVEQGVRGWTDQDERFGNKRACG